MKRLHGAAISCSVLCRLSRVGDNAAGVSVCVCIIPFEMISPLFRSLHHLRPSIFCPLLSLAVFPSVFFLKDQIGSPHTHMCQHIHTYTPSEKRGDRKVNIAGNNPVLFPWRTGFSGVCLCPLSSSGGQRQGRLSSFCPQTMGPLEGARTDKVKQGPWYR